MASLRWDTSHAVFVTEIDDEHKEIFEAVSEIERMGSTQTSILEVSKLSQRLIRRVGEHFAHEERLMRAARYSALQWHKRQHDHAKRRVQEFAARMELGDQAAGFELVRYLHSWLFDHTCIADRMMGAFLRNDRCMGKVTIRTSTKPTDAVSWTDSNGERFNPPRLRGN